MDQIVDRVSLADYAVLDAAFVVDCCHSVKRAKRNQWVEINLAPAVLNQRVNQTERHPLGPVAVVAVVVATHVLFMELKRVIHHQQDIDDLLCVALLVVRLLEHS